MNADEIWAPGETVGPFQIHRHLGSGGVGDVYLAEDSRLGRRVALKLLHRRLTGDHRSRQRFLLEARLAAALDHANICTIHEVGEESGQLFIAMQFIEGEMLRDRIAGRPLEWSELFSIVLQVAAGLSTAHERGIIHRDIKSNNIMVTPRGQAKLLDFGLARLLIPAEGASADLTRTGGLLGTPAYMSPEQARGEPTDHRTDIFSFGVVLYEMATGRIPFRRETAADTIHALLQTPHTPVIQLREDAPPAFSELLDRALAKRTGDRYQSLAEMAARLRDLESQTVAPANPARTLPAAEGHPTLLDPPAQRQPRRRVGRRRAIITGTLLLLGLAGLLVFRPGPVSAPGQPPATTSIRSIAILPFKPLVEKDRDESLELGMADTLISRLSYLDGIDVRPLTAVRRYADLEQDALAAGREQRVDAVLEGQIQKSLDKLRVTVRLLRVGDGRQLWAGRFDEEFSDIFVIQDSLSQKVAEALAVELNDAEREFLSRRQTNNVEAYQLYLLGRFHLGRNVDDGFWKALDHFQQALAREPDFAKAHAGVADAYNFLCGFNVIPPREGFPKAREAARTALRIDPNLAEAHVALATVQLFHDWDWAAAEAAFERALLLNPGDSDAHRRYGFSLAALGRFDEALAESQRALELDPLSLDKTVGIGEVLYLARRFDEAEAQYRKTLQMDPHFGFGYWALGRALTEQGRHDEAIAAFTRAMPLSGSSPDEPAELARAYALSGRREEARETLDGLIRLSDTQYVAPAVIASVFAALGDREEAFRWLETAYAERDSLLVFLQVDPMFDPLRSDPRFTRLEERVGLRD